MALMDMPLAPRNAVSESPLTPAQIATPWLIAAVGVLALYGPTCPTRQA